MTSTCMIPEDPEITKSVQDWQARERTSQRELQERSQERQRFHARFLSTIKGLTLSAMVIGSLFVSCPFLSDSYNRWRDRTAVENAAQAAIDREDELRREAERAKHPVPPSKEDLARALHAGHLNRLAERENAWEEVIKLLGLDAAQAIEERAFASCWYGDATDENRKMLAKCIRTRLHLPEEEE